MAEEEPAEGEVGEEEDEDSCYGDPVKKLEYCRDLSEEQLTAFHEKAADNEEAVQYMALEVLKLQDFTYEGRNALLVDYFVGILVFAQEEHLSVPHTLLVYQLGMEVMEHIQSEKSMEWTENEFKNFVFRWSVKVKNTNHVPLLTTIELQKIIPFFMSTVFQHYRLYINCFNRESLHYRYDEKVVVETIPLWELKPLKGFDTMEEIEEDQFWKAEYEKEYAEWEKERLAAEARARYLAMFPLFPPRKPRRPPTDLDDYIDYAVSDKVEEVLKVLEDKCLEHRAELFDRLHIMQEMHPKKFPVKPKPPKLSKLMFPSDNPHRSSSQHQLSQRQLSQRQSAKRVSL